MGNRPKSDKSQGGLVYSTNPEFFKESDDNAESLSIPPEKQKLRVYLDSKNRRGKTVTMVFGFEGPAGELKELEKALKNHCGTGGSSKDGEILIQGDQREKVLGFLRGKGFGVK